MHNKIKVKLINERGGVGGEVVYQEPCYRVPSILLIGTEPKKVDDIILCSSDNTFSMMEQ